LLFVLAKIAVNILFDHSDVGDLKVVMHA